MKMRYLLLLCLLAASFAAGCKSTVTADTSAETNSTPHEKGKKLQATTAESVN